MVTKKKSTLVPSALLAMVPSSEKEFFKKGYAEYNYVLKIIQQAIEKDLSQLSVKEESESMFDKPNWSEYQAHLLGQRKAMRKILKLFNPNNKGEG